jgi:hypothetical protein
MTRTIHVTPEQVEAARLAVKIAGGPDKVDRMTAKIAAAEPTNGRERGEERTANG